MEPQTGSPEMTGYEKSPDYGGGGPSGWVSVLLLIGLVAVIVGSVAFRFFG